MRKQAQAELVLSNKGHAKSYHTSDRRERRTDSVRRVHFDGRSIEDASRLSHGRLAAVSRLAPFAYSSLQRAAISPAFMISEVCRWQGRRFIALAKPGDAAGHALPARWAPRGGSLRRRSHSRLTAYFLPLVLRQIIVADRPP